MAGIAQGARRRKRGRAVTRLIEVEARRRQTGVAGLRELGAVEREEGLRHRVETKGVAFLHHHADGLAPYFDDVGFGHGWISRVRLKWCRSGASTSASIVEACLSRS
jgi:hypothetical protein